MAKKMNVATFTRRAYRKKKDLSKFLRKLGKSKKRSLTAIAHKADKEMWEEVDCLACGNCCKKMTPTYSKKDINRISSHLGMTYKEFYDKWLETDDNNDIINRLCPCQFLGKNNKCSIYAIRPTDCAEFPHSNRKDVMYQVREKTFENNLTYCPATLIFVEKLKAAVEAAEVL